MRIDKEYRFETDEGTASFADLFRGRSQLLVYHFMFGPDYTAGCPSCSSIADGFDGFVVHLANHDVTLGGGVAGAAREAAGVQAADGLELSLGVVVGSDFNYDFGAAFTEEQQQSGVVEYNFRAMDVRPSPDAGKRPDRGVAAGVGTDVATFTREAPGMSAFALEDGVVYHTYSAYARGLDGLWGMYQWLDRAPRGRNETMSQGSGRPPRRLLVPPPRRVRQRVTLARRRFADIEEEREVGRPTDWASGNDYGLYTGGTNR